MYVTDPATIGVGTAGVGLAATGFAPAIPVLIGVFCLIVGVMLYRVGRQRSRGF